MLVLILGLEIAAVLVVIADQQYLIVLKGGKIQSQLPKEYFY